MSVVEKFSNTIASKLSSKLNMDKDKEEILAYGAFALVQTLISMVMVTIFGITFDVLTEALIISFTASFLRKSSGGAHATSPMNCAVISVIIFGGLAILVKHYIVNRNFLYLLLGEIIAYTFAYYVMYKYSPVESENKPIRSDKTRNRLKRMSIKLVHSLLTIDVILIMLYFQVAHNQFLIASICISLGVTWQCITMVSLGQKIIDKLDKVLGDTSKIIRGEF